jgi:AbrB family looped-hinge helix DNA binding protein
MRITSKGQVTIPKKLRAQFALLPDTEVKFVAENRALRLVKTKSKEGKGWKLVQKMTGSATTKLSTEQIMRLTRG